MATAAKELTRKCKECKAPFVFTNNNQRYCTPACQDKAENKKKTADRGEAGMGPKVGSQKVGGNHPTNWIASAAKAAPEDLAEWIFQMLVANEDFALAWWKLQAKVEHKKRRDLFVVASRSVDLDE